MPKYVLEIDADKDYDIHTFESPLSKDQILSLIENKVEQINLLDLTYPSFPRAEDYNDHTDLLKARKEFEYLTTKYREQHADLSDLIIGEYILRVNADFFTIRNFGLHTLQEWWENQLLRKTNAS